MGESVARSGLEAARLRRALVTGIAGLLCVSVALVISLAAGYDNLASGTLGGNVTTVLFVASAVLLLVAAISWTRAATLAGGRTSWRRVGRSTLFVWGVAITLLVFAIIMGRVAVALAPIAVLIASLVPVLLLPTLLWFPLWTLISAIRGQGTPGQGETRAQESSEASAVSPSKQVTVAPAPEVVLSPDPAREPRKQGAGPSRGLLVAGAVIGVVIVSLIATVFYLLGRQSSISTQESAESSSAPTPAASNESPSIEPTAEPSAPAGQMTPAELYGLAAAAQGCTGRIPEDLPPDAATGFISFDSGLVWEPIYVETAKRLGVPEGGSEDLTESLFQNYLYRMAAFSAAESADPRSWYDLNQLWIKANDYAYTRSEEVVLAGEPRGYAFLDVAKKYGPRITKACLDPVYRAMELAKADGLTFDAWIQQYKPDMGPWGSS